MKNLALGILCSFFSFLGYSQAICGFDKIHQSQLKADPAYAKMVDATNASIRKYINNQLKADPRFRLQSTLYTIPVVVHVMHTGGGIGSIYNPTDAQIIATINYLNDVYAGTFSGMKPQEGGTVNTDIQIRFALAQRTPTCGVTNGIERVDASSIPNYMANGVRAQTTSGCTDSQLKNFARWDPANYYNIYVVNKIDGADGTSGQFVAGYAMFAGGTAALDGTVMLATQMAPGEKTLPHEIGHALNLYHTFEGSGEAADCPTNAIPLANGDRVADTDPVDMNYNPISGLFDFSCRTGSNNCIVPNRAFSINTEENFMAYTFCYNLFTEGQKSRMLSAMATIPGRISLVSPGNMSLVPCGTTINFTQASATATESISGTTAGCRRFTDYTYQLNIGSAPSADATVTFSYTGTAVAGVDYDITTNGNFASPGNTLSFVNGSVAPQSFIVRIYDDATVETTESFVVDFTVDNGGGNASKGTIAPSFTFILNDNDIAPVAAQAGTYQVGAFEYIQDEAPFDAKRPSHRGQYLYKASELLATGIQAGMINSFGLFVYSKLSTRPFTNFTIKMGQTSLTNLIDGSVTYVSGLSTVYTSSSYSTIAGWNDFLLSVPFSWNGTSSLVVEICYDNGVADVGNFADVMAYYADGSSPSQGNMIFQNGINCSGNYSAVNYFTEGIKPMMHVGVTVTGTPVENTLNATNTLQVSNASDDYLYSNPGNKLLARLQGTSARLGCVTASLEGAGTSWLGYAGGQRSAKILAITPTQNSASASYTISLYFNNTELDGKNPAFLKIAKSTAASIAGANGSNTLLVTPTVTALGSDVTVFTASFTGFSRFFLVDNAVSLPIALLDFKGSVTANKNSLLEWTTSYEKNNLRFEIEISRDGSNFILLDQVTSQGDADLGHSYSYLHIRPVRGINYYRLKQVDIDGKSTYSRVLNLAVDSNADPRPFVSPNPASELIKINFGRINTVPVQIEILGADLKSIYKETAGAGTINHSLTISKLPAGLYFIRMVIAGKTEVLRFVKE